MKDDETKKNNNISLPHSNNPFLNKPLKKINNQNPPNTKPIEPPKENHQINEHRASRFININNKTSKLPSHAEKKPLEHPKITGNQNLNDKKSQNNLGIISQGENKINKENEGTGFKTLLKKFGSQEKVKALPEKNEDSKKHRKRASIERYLNPKIEENFKKENNIEDQKNFATNNSDHGDENMENKRIQVIVKESLSKKNQKEKKDKFQNNPVNNNNPISNNKIIEVNNKNNEYKKDDTIKNIIPKKDDLLHFKNDDEILEYIKNKIKEGKLKNIYQKLELKNDDFSGFSLTQKEKGYIQYEINLEQDIKKVNEEFKKKKIELNKKPIQLVYSEDLLSLIKAKQEYDCLKEVTYFNVKNDYEKSESISKPQGNLNNKPLENKNIKNESSKLKTNNLTIEGNLKLKEKEPQAKEKITPKISVDENKFAGVGAIPDMSEKKIKEIQNQKRMSKAYGRFKKAFSLHKDKDKESEKNSNSNKIHFLASMLKEHIIQPLSEIQEENDTGGKMYRGGSVECRKSKIIENNIVKIYENAPVTKKNVKKPKLNNFVQ